MNVAMLTLWNSLRIRIRDTGGSGTPLVLIHGLANSIEIWDRVMPALAAHFRVIAFDLPGFGQADRPDAAYDGGFFADQLCAMLDTLGIERAHLVGSSLGASIIIRFAADHLERIDRAVLAAPGGFGRRTHPLMRVPSLPLVGSSSMAGMADRNSEILSIELPLADSHIQIQKTFDFIEEEPEIKSEQKTVQKAEGAHMPSVLVDQLLLEEIASIPDRFGFKIGDVAELLTIKQYVLRYWEQEFDLLKPKKASNNQRLYTKKDVENAFLIRKLLYRDKFSIEGARQALRDVKFAVRKEKDMSSVMLKLDKSNSAMASQVKDLVKDIQRIKELFI